MTMLVPNYRGHRISLRSMPISGWGIRVHDSMNAADLEFILHVKTHSEAIAKVKEVIDYQYRIEAFEAVNGREYDASVDGYLEDC